MSGAPTSDRTKARRHAVDPAVDLLAFLERNPGTIETVEGLAARLGDSVEGLSRQVDDGVALGRILRRPAGGRLLIQYTQGGTA